MKEIKFRGKSKKGEWIFGDLIQRTHKFIFPTGVYAYNIFEFLVEVIPETVGQYTGLKDKDGTKIYEGDVVQISGHPFQRNKQSWGGINIDGNYEVSWNEHAVGFSIGTWKFIEVYKYCEVIGNIHENPELLEGSQNESSHR